MLTVALFPHQGPHMTFLWTVNWVPRRVISGRRSSAWSKFDYYSGADSGRNQGGASKCNTQPPSSSQAAASPHFPGTYPVLFNTSSWSTHSTESTAVTLCFQVAYGDIQEGTIIQTATTRGRKGQSAVVSEEGWNFIWGKKSGKASWRR